jgi:hypothetical protein
LGKGCKSDGFHKLNLAIAEGMLESVNWEEGKKRGVRQRFCTDTGVRLERCVAQREEVSSNSDEKETNETTEEVTNQEKTEHGKTEEKRPNESTEKVANNENTQHGKTDNSVEGGARGKKAESSGREENSESASLFGKPVYPLVALQQGSELPEGVDPKKREEHLSGGDFRVLLGAGNSAAGELLEFWEQLPAWKKKSMKQRHRIF